MSLEAASNCSKVRRKVHMIYLVKENEGICVYDGFGRAKAALIVDGNLASKLKLFQLDLQKVNKRYMRRILILLIYP